MSTHTSLESLRSQLSIDVWVDMVQKSSVPSNSRSTASGLIIPYKTVRNDNTSNTPTVAMHGEDQFSGCCAFGITLEKVDLDLAAIRTAQG